MHKFKKDEQGNLILVTNPEEGATYLDADGNEVVHEAPRAPAVHTDDNPIKELTGLVSSMVENQDKVLQRVDQMEQSVAAYKEAAARGFPIQSPHVPAGATVDETKQIFEPFDLAKQGKDLMDKFKHPGYQIQDHAVREEVAKWMILFLKAGIPFIFSANSFGMMAASDKANIASASLSRVLQRESAEAI